MCYTIRLVTNGWAVNNRSGEIQQIQLSEEVIGVERGDRVKITIFPTSILDAVVNQRL
ncbi:MAG: hypothetical protein OXP71_07170 [Candidatus Poribacteria bacterium]|nr:hypothetical protein [Candidatus Poribacteria bacterium]